MPQSPRVVSLLLASKASQPRKLMVATEALVAPLQVALVRLDLKIKVARAAVNESFHAGYTISVQDDNNVIMTVLKELLALLFKFDNTPHHIAGPGYSTGRT